MFKFCNEIAMVVIHVNVQSNLFNNAQLPDLNIKL